MDGWHTFYRTAIVLGTVVGAYLLWQLGEIILVLFAAIIFASTIRPYVDLLMRIKIPQGVAILLIYVIIFSAFGILLYFTIPPLARMTVEILSGDLILSQVQAIVRDALIFAWREFNVVIPIRTVPEQIQEFVGQADIAARAQALPFALSTVAGIGQLLLALIMCFYWLTTRERLLNFLLLLSPVRHRARTEAIWTDIENTLGWYVRSQVILALSVGTASYIGLFVIQVPYALPLAVFAGMTEVIPYVGPVLGGIPAVLIAFSDSPVKGLLVLGWYVLIQQLESSILVPKIMQSNVGLNPLLVIVAVIAGGSLGGVIGAILAIPVAGAAQVIAQHLLIQPTLDKRQWTANVDGGVLIQTEEDKENSTAEEKAQIYRSGAK
jgi:predicted PurR-regulated permease PerM